MSTSLLEDSDENTESAVSEQQMTEGSVSQAVTTGSPTADVRPLGRYPDTTGIDAHKHVY